MELEQRNYAKADSMLQLAQQLNPNSIEILNERFTALYFLGEYEKIIEIGKEAIENDIIRADVYWMIAESYNKLDDYKNAKKYFKKALKISDEKGEIYLDLHKIAFLENRNKSALKYLKKAEKYAGNNINLLHKVALAFGFQDNKKKFIEILQKIISLKPNDIQANNLLGNYFYTNDNYEMAIPYYENLKNESPQVWESVRSKLFFSYYFTGNYEKIVDNEYLFQEQFQNSFAQNIFFVSAFRCGDYAKTIKYGKDILEKDAKTDSILRDEVLEILAKTEFEIKKHKQAFDYFSQLTSDNILLNNLPIITNISTEIGKIDLLNRLEKSEISQKNDTVFSTIQTSIAYYYSKQDSLEMAKKILEKIDKNKISNDYSINLLAHILMKLDYEIDSIKTFLENRKNENYSITIWFARYYIEEELYEKALSYLQKAEKEDSTKIDIYFLMARTYKELGDFESEIAILEKGVKLYPENPNLLNWLGYTLVENDRNLNYALTILQKAISFDPKNIFIWDSVAWAYYKLGEFHKALQSMKLILAWEFRDSVACYHLGNIFWKLDKIDSAKENWKLSIEINNDDEAKMLSEKMLKKLEESKNEN